MSYLKSITLSLILTNTQFVHANRLDSVPTYNVYKYNDQTYFFNRTSDYKYPILFLESKVRTSSDPLVTFSMKNFGKEHPEIVGNPKVQNIFNNFDIKDLELVPDIFEPEIEGSEVFYTGSTAGAQTRSNDRTKPEQTNPVLLNAAFQLSTHPIQSDCIPISDIEYWVWTTLQDQWSNYKICFRKTDNDD